MWAEFHIMAGLGVYGIAHTASGGDVNLAPAIALSCMTHPLIDDANVDAVSLYHGWGEKLWQKVATTIARVIFWIAIIFGVFWHHPEALAVALPAWLICDFEWFYKMGVGIGIHHDTGKPWYMYPKWIKTPWGLIPVLTAIMLYVWMVN